MANHEDSHGHDNDHDNTEGSRQYYPQGWYIPLIGLFVVAFFFALGAGALLGISGTDKWGKSSEEHGHGTHQTDDHHGHGGDGDGHKHDAAAKGDAENNKAQDSVADTISTAHDTMPKMDSPAKAEHGSGDGHGHGH